MVLEDGSIDMESSDSYISSPDVNHKRSSGGGNRNNPHDGKEKPTSIRFLVSNGAAGSVIGKGGSTITEFQSQSGARIQLSRNQEYFPGTTDRIIMVSGCVNEILMAIELILGKLQSEMHAEAGEEIESMTKVRLVVPNSACGGIIGKGGSTIKSFIEDSQAGIKISPLDQNYGVSDRVVTVTGSFEEQLRALLLIINKLIEDPNYVNYASQPLSYTGNMNGNYGVPMGYVIPSVAPVAYNMVNYGSGNGSSGKMYNNKGLVAPVIALRPSNNGMPDAQTSPAKPVVLGIADDHIGVLLGRGGRNISEIMQASGAKVKISDRGDFITGTSNRKVTIMGSLEAIHAAQVLINQRLSTLTEQQ